MKNSRKLWLGFLSILLICAIFEVGSCFETKMSNVLGGISDSHAGSENDLEIETLGKFAVDEHNKKQNALLEFTRVVKAKTQVVSGTMHHLTVEANEGGEKKTYEAKVWVKPWANFKELQEFTPATAAAEGN